MPSNEPRSAAPTGPVIFAYDGSDLAAHAIEQAGRQLALGRDALIVCVWQPGDVGFAPARERHIDANQAAEVEAAATEVAAQGAALAERAGFRSQSKAVWAAPTWKGVVETADEHGASLIVMGSHCRTGLVGRLIGSVAGAVVAHSTRSVLVVHQQPDN